MSKCILGVDIGGTNFRCGMVNSRQEISFGRIESSQSLFQTDSSAETLVDYLGEYIAYTKIKPDIISIGIPGTVDKKHRATISIPNIQGFNNCMVADIIEQHLKIKTLINRDVNLLLLHDMRKINISSKSIVLGFYLGTGIGNAIYINGNIYTGSNGVAGELGHIAVPNNNLMCGCGNKGCIETIASGKALVQLGKKHFKEVPVSDLFSVVGNTPEVCRFIDCLSMPIATEINILDPDYVIIGGGVPQMRDFPKKRFEQAVLSHTRKPFPANSLTMIYVGEDQFDGIFGAAIFAKSYLNGVEAGCCVKL